MTNKEELLRKITPKNDVIFKKIFGTKGNEGILKDFLESILEIKIESLTLDVGTELLPDFGDGKVSRLDVLTKLEDGTLVNIEIQTNMQEFSDKRELAYWSRLYLRQFKRGDNYENVNKAISIWILDGSVYDFKKYHSKWKIAEDDEGKVNRFDDFEIHVIELKKFRKLDIINPRKKEFWLWFIDHTKKELIDVSGYSLEEIRKAKEQYEKMIEDDEAIQHLLLREDLAEWERNSMKALARKEGLEEGRKEGIEAGKREGKREAKLETAKKLLDKGIDVETILEITGLTKEDIEELKKQ